jgi:hypothetical protein
VNLQCVTKPGRVGVGWQDARPPPQQVLPPAFVSGVGSEDGANDIMSMCGVKYQVLGNVREEVFDNSASCFLMCRARPAEVWMKRYPQRIVPFIVAPLSLA